MTLPIAQITNAALQKLAYLKDANNNGVLEENEFIKFKSEASERKDISAEDFNQAMGLYITEPSKAQAVVSPEEGIRLDGKDGSIDSSKYYWDELIEMFYADSLKDNGGMHTIKEIREQLKKVNNIPKNYPAIPKGLLMPSDLFGDGSCKRTEQKEISLRKRVLIGRPIAPAKILRLE